MPQCAVGQIKSATTANPSQFHVGVDAAFFAPRFVADKFGISWMVIMQPTT